MATLQPHGEVALCLGSLRCGLSLTRPHAVCSCGSTFRSPSPPHTAAAHVLGVLLRNLHVQLPGTAELSKASLAKSLFAPNCSS